MIGDKLVITDYHRACAHNVMKVIHTKRVATKQPLAISIAGESGSGKSEIAHCLCELIEELGMKAIILSQDDYFKLPPKTNHQKRLEDISWVGTREVKLELLDKHILHLKTQDNAPFIKPLVYYDEDRLSEETIYSQGLDVVIAEGTYTTLLNNVDIHAFIDRTYTETKKARIKRDRDPAIDFVEKVLEIEHIEISKHKAYADIIL